MVGLNLSRVRSKSVQEVGTDTCKRQQKLGRYGNVQDGRHGNVQKLGHDVNLGKISTKTYKRGHRSASCFDFKYDMYDMLQQQDVKEFS